MTRPPDPTVPVPPSRTSMLAAGALVLCAACGGPPSAPQVEFSRGPGSGMPHLAEGRDGRVVLTWLEPAGEGRHALRFAVRSEGRWSEPGTVVERDDFFVNWADFPSLLETEDGVWVAHWLQKTAARPYAYHVMLATSADGGRTWSAPFRAHSDSSDTEHGFVAMARRPGGGADLLWLDGHAMGGPENGAMAIRTAFLGAAGPAGEVELDGRTCECCQTALARTTRGLIAAYRDRTSEEIRDIAVVREVDGRWTDPVVPAPDHWEHRACPVNGPALTAQGDRVTLAWYTGVGGEGRVYLVQSADGGATWGERVRLDRAGALGRVDLAPLSDGSVAAVWLEEAGEAEAEWRLSRIAPSGEAGPTRTLARVSRARLAGFPRMAVSGPDLLVGFTATGDSGGVRVVRTLLR